MYYIKRGAQIVVFSKGNGGCDLLEVNQIVEDEAKDLMVPDREKGRAYNLQDKIKH